MKKTNVMGNVGPGESVLNRGPLAPTFRAIPLKLFLFSQQTKKVTTVQKGMYIANVTIVTKG